MKEYEKEMPVISPMADDGHNLCLSLTKSTVYGYVFGGRNTNADELGFAAVPRRNKKDILRETLRKEVVSLRLL